jgi:hypothetical protein
MSFFFRFQLIIFFSFIYIRFFQSKYESELSSTIVSILALAVALFTSALVPVDIFLVSYMKYSNGTFKVRKLFDDSHVFQMYVLVKLQGQSSLKCWQSSLKCSGYWFFCHLPQYNNHLDSHAGCHVPVFLITYFPSIWFESQAKEKVSVIWKRNL